MTAQLHWQRVFAVPAPKLTEDGTTDRYLNALIDTYYISSGLRIFVKLRQVGVGGWKERERKGRGREREGEIPANSRIHSDQQNKFP